MSSHSYTPLFPGIRQLPYSADDPKSDEAISKLLCSFVPVRHQKNIWAFWDTGYENMVAWRKRNVISWVHRMGQTWDVRCVDLVPGSPNNLFRFVEKATFPPALSAGTMDGTAKGPHASDMARLALIFHHGGVYLDVSSFVFCDFDEAFWSLIEDPDSPYEFCGFHYPFRQWKGQILTGFLACNKGNVFLKRWMKVFFELWSDRKNAVGLHKHPLLQHLEPLGPIIEVDIGMGAVDGPDQHIYMDYFAMIFAYERVRLLHDPTDGWNGLEYFKHHFLLCDALDEMWRCHVMAPIEQQFHLLSLPCEPENQQEVQVQAREWVREVTTNSAIAKFNSSYWQPGIPYPLAKKWDEMPHRNADIASGTWAAYMRHASKYFTQERFKATSLKPVPINDEFGQVFVGELLVPISLAPKESLVAEGKRSDE